MQMYILAIRDRAADVFGQPMFVASIGGACRSFGDEVNRADPKNNLHAHPEDFDLYELGTYDDTEASFTLLERPRMIAVGKDMVRK